MAQVSDWQTEEAKNTHLDDLTLSGEGGLYSNKIMCAVKKKFDEVDNKSTFSTLGIASNSPFFSIKQNDIDFTTIPTKNGYAGINYYDKNSVLVGSIENRYFTSGANAIALTVKSQSQPTKLTSVYLYTYEQTYSWHPDTTNEVSLGLSTNVWKEVYAGNGTIQTSDEKVKRKISSIPDAVLDAWGDVSWVQYKFADAMEKKGAEARLHTGAVAQAIEAVFESHGLDASDYGLFCRDQTAEGEESFGVRYSEALAVEAAYQRRRADRMEARLSAVESALASVMERGDAID